MKLLIIILNLLLLANKYCNAQEYNFKWYSDQKQSDIISLPDESNFQSFTTGRQYWKLWIYEMCNFFIYITRQ